MSLRTEEYPADEHTPGLTVHHFQHHASSQPSSQQILQAGKSIVDACTTSETWHYPTPTPSGPSFCSRGRCYAYVLSPPPPTKGVARGRRDEIKHWDSTIDDAGDEVFSLQDLEEFQSNPAQRQAATQPLEAPKRKAITRDDSDSPRKRSRFSDQSLYRVIPQPHICASPDDAPSPGTINQTGLITYLSNNKPVPVPPYTQDKVDEVLLDPYARCAWVIPVRGCPPWPGCTAASVLDPSHASDEATSPPIGPRAPSTASTDDALRGQIIWTQNALFQFWDFLLKLQEGGALGPITLSFHAAPTARQESVPGTSATPAIVAGHAVETPPLVSGQTGSFSPRSYVAPPAPLLATDHVKVYHGARYAMRLRHILYAWTFEARQPGNAEGVAGVARKVRVLKGARLVLLDERAKGMLTM